MINPRQQRAAVEKIAALVMRSLEHGDDCYLHVNADDDGKIFIRLLAESAWRQAARLQRQLDVYLKVMPLCDYHEDYGPVLWWRFPIKVPPYVGSPICRDWPDYHTHFSRIPEVKLPTQ